MHAKPFILAILAACGLSTGPESSGRSDAPESPGDFDGPHVKPLEGKHFCCSSVDPDKLTGEGCIGIPDDNAIINACSYVLYCPDAWTKADGKVACE
jgi:hypothetical protein